MQITRTMSRCVATLGLLLGLVCLCAAAGSGVAAAQANKGAQADKAALFAALKAGDAFAMMRHAIAPGTGDPANFKIGDCSTQRNLSDTGRAQSRVAGDLFREAGLGDIPVFTSQWCRCRETARLMALGPVQDLESLNSFFRNRQRGAPQTAQLRSWLGARARNAKGGQRAVVLVTHQVNITGLTGRWARSGEILIVAWPTDGKAEPTVLGSVTPEAEQTQ